MGIVIENGIKIGQGINIGNFVTQELFFVNEAQTDNFTNEAQTDQFVTDTLGNS